MSQGSFDNLSELVELDDEFEITEINDDDEELQELLEELGDPSLLDPLSGTPSPSQNGIQKIERLNKALNKEVPLRPRSNSSQGKKPKLESLKGQVVATDPLKKMLDELDTLKKSNEQNRVTAKFLTFTKSDFEKTISDPLEKFLAEAEKGVKTNTPMPTTVYEEQFLPIYNAINNEIEDKKKKAKKEKPPKSDGYLFKAKCAENLMVTLRRAFKLWKGQENERARIVIADMEENGQLDYLKTLATDKERYSKLKGGKETQKEFLTYLQKLGSDPCVLRGVISKLISAKKPGRGPELVYDLLDSLKSNKEFAEVLVNSIPGSPKEKHELVVNYFRESLKTQHEDTSTFLRGGTMGISTAVAELQNDKIYSTLSPVCQDSFELLLQYDEKLRKQKKKAKSDGIDEDLVQIYKLIYKAILVKLDASLVTKELLDYMRCIAERIFEFRPNDVALVKERIADFVALRIVNPMLIDVSGAIGKKKKLTPEAKRTLQSHATAIGKVIQKAGTKARLDTGLKKFEAEYNQLVERLVKIANNIYDRLYEDLEGLEELEEFPNDEEDYLPEIVEYNNREFVLGKITTSNPFLWLDLDPKVIGKRFCISTAEPTVEGNWNRGNQFCALMSVKWLNTRPQTLKLGELSQQEQVEMANQLADSSMEQQVGSAVNLLKSQATSELSQNTVTRIGARIWMGNDRHVVAAQILGDGLAKFYDPDDGTTLTITTDELQLRAGSYQTFVASA